MARIKPRADHIGSEPFTPTPGTRYSGRFGGRYICERILAPGVALMSDTTTGAIFHAHGCRQYEDGTIKWEYTYNVHYEERR